MYGIIGTLSWNTITCFLSIRSFFFIHIVHLHSANSRFTFGKFEIFCKIQYFTPGFQMYSMAIFNFSICKVNEFSMTQFFNIVRLILVVGRYMNEDDSCLMSALNECMIKLFWGRGEGVVDWEGATVKDA